MKTKWFSMIPTLVFLSFMALLVAITAAVGGKASEPSAPVYQPPKEEPELRRRVGGADDTASRGFARGFARGFIRAETSNDKETPMPSLIAPLAPETVGIAASKQPALFFYVSSAWPHEIRFTLNSEEEIEPILSIPLAGPAREGILKVDLKKHGVRLKPDVEYEWFVTITPDQKERSADFFGSAVLKHRPPSKEFSDRLKNAPKDKHHYLYAEAGFFYDAIQEVCRLVDVNKEAKKFKRRRAALSEQVNLPVVAEYDRKK